MNANIQLETEAVQGMISSGALDVPSSTDTVKTAHLVRTVGFNTFCQVSAQLAPAAAAIFSIPILLRHLGPEAYGIVTLFSTVLIYFAMLDLGLGRATTRFIAQSLEAGNREDVGRYFWSSLLLLTGAGLTVSGCFLLAAPVLVTHYLKISPAYRHDTIQAFYLICATIPLVTLMAGLRGFLEASGRFPYLSAVTACAGASMYAVPVLVIIKGGGLVAIAATYVAIRIGMAIAFAIGCMGAKLRPPLRPTPDRKALKQMASFGGWLSLSNVIGTAMVYGDRFLLGSFAGMAAVASYSMPLDVIGRMQILITSFCAVLFPLLSRLDGSGSAHFQRVYRGALAIVLSSITPLTVTVILLSPFLMKLWLREHNTSEAVFAAQVFLAGSIVQAMASISFTALHARGRSDLAAWAHSAEFPVYCIAFFWAATRFGVRGAALVWFGRVITDFACMVVLLRVEERSRGFLLTPQLAAILISVLILLTSIFQPAHALVLEFTICLLTWLWTWGVLLDSEMRRLLAHAMSSSVNMFFRTSMNAE
ncbi:MAG TPA: flippase [Candidatus Binatia bacterium]|nr:flippase [Candidatus Binatia bacterium]